MQNTKNIKFPEIINPAKSKNNFLTSELFWEKKREDLELEVNIQVSVI